MKKERNKKLPSSKDARYVPISVFQSAIPSLKAKIRRPYTEYLLKNNPDILTNLIEFWKINRYKHFYLFKLKFDKEFAKDYVLSKFKKFTYGSKEDEPIYEVLRLTINKSLNDLYIYIKIHSPKKHFKSEDFRPPFNKIEADHRKPYFINSIFHLEENIVECRTSNFKKSKELLDFITHVILSGNAKAEQIIIDNSKLVNADKNAKCREARIIGEWFGANEITVSGYDVKKCLDEFKSRGIDFHKEKLQIAEVMNQSEELLVSCNADNGKISIKMTEEKNFDPFRYLKSKVRF